MLGVIFTPSKRAIRLRRSGILPLGKRLLFCSVTCFSVLRSIYSHNSCLSKLCVLVWSGVSFSS